MVKSCDRKRPIVLLCFSSIHRDLKQGDALSSLLFNFVPEYATRRVQENRMCLELNDKQEILVYADAIIMLGENLQSVENTQKSS